MGDGKKKVISKILALREGKKWKEVELGSASETDI